MHHLSKFTTDSLFTNKNKYHGLFTPHVTYMTATYEIYSFLLPQLMRFLRSLFLKKTSRTSYTELLVP